MLVWFVGIMGVGAARFYFSGTEKHKERQKQKETQTREISGISLVLFLDILCCDVTWQKSMVINLLKWQTTDDAEKERIKNSMPAAK